MSSVVFDRHGAVVRPSQVRAAWRHTVKVYNTGVVFNPATGKWFGIFRVCKILPSGDWYSVLVSARSDDGLRWTGFKIFLEPGALGATIDDRRGYEDASLVRVAQNLWYAIWTCHDGVAPRLGFSTSPDLVNWTHHPNALADFRFLAQGGHYVDWTSGNPQIVTTHNPEHPESPDVRSKSGVIFPHLIGNKYYMLFGEYAVWLAESNDGVNWSAAGQPLLTRREGDFFDNILVETAAPPLSTAFGWLVFYHGVDQNMCYRLGWVVLDKGDPRRILAKCNEPIFYPQGDECAGSVDVVPGMMDALASTRGRNPSQTGHDHAVSVGLRPQVVFVKSAVLTGLTLRFFYGAGDLFCASASADWRHVLKLIEEQLA